ncbi:MAG: hypothetical protein KDA28_05200, partial [Phycisphaerales bacterium]|nr:hypothetical protein [Phycisphaerales bacterium]
KAGADGPARSRRPESLGVTRKALTRACRRGLVVPTGDGRYHLDRDAVRRSDLRSVIWMVVGLVCLVPIVWLLW